MTSAVPCAARQIKEQVGPIVVPPENQWTSPELFCYSETCRCVHSAKHDSDDLYCGAQAARREYCGNIWTLVRKLENINAWGCPFEHVAPKGTLMTWEDKIEMVTLNQCPDKYAELMAFIDARVDEVDDQGLEMMLAIVEITPARVQEFADVYRELVSKYTARGEVYSYTTELRVQLIRATLTGLAMKNPEMSTFTGWKAIYDTLTPREQTFVRQVRDNDSCKIGVGRYDESGTRAVWERPEELGLVTCVGSYKWHCTAPDALLDGRLS